MIDNDDLFIDNNNDDDDIISDDESINLNEHDINEDLVLEDIMILDEFDEQSKDNSNSNIFNQQPDESINYDDSNIDFEAIFDEKSD
jgi:hypothetical protein